MVGYPSPTDLLKSLRGDGSWSSILNAPNLTGLLPFTTITDRTLPVIKLSGYPSPVDATKVLKGDGTWGAPPASAFGDG